MNVVACCCNVNVVACCSGAAVQLEQGGQVICGAQEHLVWTKTGQCSVFKNTFWFGKMSLEVVVNIDSIYSCNFPGTLVGKVMQQWPKGTRLYPR